jgi:hypothetical protein
MFLTMWQSKHLVKKDKGLSKWPNLIKSTILYWFAGYLNTGIGL